jgi:hypothetical protein
VFVCGVGNRDYSLLGQLKYHFIFVWGQLTEIDNLLLKGTSGTSAVIILVSESKLNPSVEHHHFTILHLEKKTLK